VAWSYQSTLDGVYSRRRLGIDPECQQADRLLNFAAILDRPSPDDPGHHDRLLPARTGNRYTLHYDAKQSHIRDSRVQLGGHRNRFRLRGLRVDWRFSEADVDSVVHLQAQRRHLPGGPRTDAARPRDAARPGPQPGQRGQPPPGNDQDRRGPGPGVVDRDCRVHGIRNLWIASGSVFVTASYARPTPTSVALAIRLAEHLNELL
jgi:choline dehydrogenase-like flavoprotein